MPSVIAASIADAMPARKSSSVRVVRLRTRHVFCILTAMLLLYGYPIEDLPLEIVDRLLEQTGQKPLTESEKLAIAEARQMREEAPALAPLPSVPSAA